jgi:radical SAM superfamily enzyme YgiQ (UPF0313 family)
MTRRPTVKLIVPPHSFLSDTMGALPLLPVGLGNISSYLRQNKVECTIDDMEIKLINNEGLFTRFNALQRQYDAKMLEDFLLDSKPSSVIDEISGILFEVLDKGTYNLVGFSITEATSLDFALIIAKKLKEDSGPVIVFGGCAVRTGLAYSFVDHIIVGPGAEKIWQIVTGKKLATSFGNTLLPDYRGIDLELYRSDPDHSSFSNPGNILILPYKWSEGCPYRCTFCGNSATRGGVLLIEPELAARQMAAMADEYDTRYFFLLNEYIHVDEKHTARVCEQLSAQNKDLLLSGCVRADLKEGLIALLGNAGLFLAVVGLESGSDSVLRRMEKGYDRNIAEMTIRKLAMSKMWVSINIIVGFPGESEKEFLETFDFVEKNIDYIDQLSVCVFRLGDSAVYRNPAKYGITIQESLEQGKNNTYQLFSYSDRDHSWSELQKIHWRRLKILRKLYTLHKQIPDNFLRISTHRLYHSFDKERDREKVYGHFLEAYHRHKNEERIIITEKDNNKSLHAPKRAVLNYRQIGSKMQKMHGKSLVITGGEPTLSEDLLKVVEYGLQKFDMVLETNARRLTYPEYAKKLYSLGLRKIRVKVFSNTPNLHDCVTRVRGSFEQTVGGINNWRKLGGTVEIIADMRYVKYNSLPDFVDFIVENETIVDY